MDIVAGPQECTGSMRATIFRKFPDLAAARTRVGAASRGIRSAHERLMVFA